MNKVIEFRFLPAFFLLVILSFSCTEKKEVKILGFAYENDVIIVQGSNKEVFHLIVKGNVDKNKLCSFYEMMHISWGEDVRLKITIDSANIHLLDTIVIIPKEKKEPFISLLYPFNQSPYKRALFIADEADSTFLKY